MLEGQDFSAFLEWRNLGENQQDDVSLKLLLPDGVSLVPGTSVLVTGTNRDGVVIGDGLSTSRGVNLGSYAPGGNLIVQFTLHFSAVTATSCGTTELPLAAYRFAFDGPQLHETVPIALARVC